MLLVLASKLAGSFKVSTLLLRGEPAGGAKVSFG